MSTDRIAIRSAQALGITLSAMVAGSNFCYTMAAIPALQVPGIAPAQALRSWKCAYEVGKAYMPAVGGVASLFYGYLIYRSLTSWPSAIPDLPAPNTDLLTGAIVANLGIGAFTALVMAPGTNARLEEMLADSGRGGMLAKSDEARVRNELSVWGQMNLIRAFFPLSGAVLGFLACF